VSAERIADRASLPQRTALSATGKQHSGLSMYSPNQLAMSLRPSLELSDTTGAGNIIGSSMLYLDGPKTSCHIPNGDLQPTPAEDGKVPHPCRAKELRGPVMRPHWIPKDIYKWLRNHDTALNGTVGVVNKHEAPGG
jgi:hypothetical protein